MTSLSVFLFCKLWHEWQSARDEFVRKAFSNTTMFMMFRCDVAILAIVLSLVLHVAAVCDDESTARIYQQKFCNLTRNVGSCKLRWKRFFFNKVTRLCEPFIYEGENCWALSRDSLISFQDVQATATISRLKQDVFPVASGSNHQQWKPSHEAFWTVNWQEKRRRQNPPH